LPYYTEEDQQNNAYYDVNFSGLPHEVAVALRPGGRQRYGHAQNDRENLADFKKFHAPKWLKSCVFFMFQDWVQGRRVFYSSFQTACFFAC
jgi:hypothetical protein